LQEKILKDLLMDGRKTCAQIAREIGVPKATIYKNYRELIKNGVIVGATVHINYKSFGYLAVACLIINIDPSKADELVNYARKLKDIYAAFRAGAGGSIRIVATLRTLRQLDEIKDNLKQKFSILSLKTVVWTDVKEMHENLALTPHKFNPDEKNKETSVEPKAPKRRQGEKEKTKPDDLDIKLTELLSNDGHMPFSQIAKELGTSTDAVSQKFSKLKRNGIVKITTQINPEKIGYRAMIIFYVTLTLSADSVAVIEQVKLIPDIISIMKTSGDYDLQIYAMIRDIDQLLAVQKEFAKIQGIAHLDLDITETRTKWPTPRQYISTF
jgi:DNA-binding Lrp family transcriptional regulator